MAELGTKSDEQLMKACAAGDLAAFEVILKRYERRILSYAFRLVGNIEAARDVYQQTFLNIFEKRVQYRQTAKFSTYVYCIAHNLCQNELRRAERRLTGSFDRAAGGEDDGASPADWLAGNSQEPSEPLAREEEDRLLHQAVGELDPIYREVIVLRIFEDLAFKEIAEITGVGESTVKSRMRYGLGYLDKALRGKLRPES
jgi:RNA polymerase sigma-70 factor (ECF subfamily)